MVTIKDIAKAANVSTMTVSRALQGSKNIRQETRERVLQAARKLHYIPNYNAKNLVMRQNDSIGLFFSSMVGTSEVFLGDLVSEIYRFLPKNYLLAVNSIDQLTPDKDHLMDSILGRFDGIIIATQSERDDPFIELIHELKIPLVVMNRLLKNPAICNISIDESLGIKEMVSYLKMQGIKTAGTIKGIPGFFSSELRDRIFQEECARLEIEISTTAVDTGEYTTTSGYHAMRRLLAPNNTLPDALFCGNDDMAIGAAKACAEQGIRIPADLSLIGFDDTKYARFFSPALTTIHKPYREMAKASMKLLLALLANKTISFPKQQLNSWLVIRDSVKEKAKA